MFKSTAQRRADVPGTECADQNDIEIIRVGDDGPGVNTPKLGDLESLWETIDIIGQHRSKIVLLVMGPGCLSPDGLDRFWEREQDILRERRTTKSGQSQFLFDLSRRGNLFRRFIQAIYESDTFVITTVQGEIDLHLFGIALACDHRIATDDVMIFNRSLQTASLPGTGIVWLLTHYLGHAQARRLILHEQSLRGVDAHKLGLVDELVEASSCEARALQIAEEFSDIPNRELCAFKRATAATIGGLAGYFEKGGTNFGFAEQLDALDRPVTRQW